MNNMHPANISAIDLNLLPMLDALLREANVSRAALRVGLSQPAASHALRRLRDLLGDPLLVRSGQRMTLTPRAEGLKGTVRDALSRVRDCLQSQPFDPSTSTRTFTLQMPDHVVDLLLPQLMTRCAAKAPCVRLDVSPWRGPASMSTELAASVDIIIGCSDAAFAGFQSEPLFSDTETVVVRKGHPLLRGRRLSRLEGFCNAPAIAVRPGGAVAEDPVDAWLREEHAATRRIALSVPGYLQALHIVAVSDLVAFVPSRLVEAAVAAGLSLTRVTPPVDPGLYHERMYYPARTAADPGSTWLRSQVLAASRALDRKSSPR